MYAPHVLQLARTVQHSIPGIAPEWHPAITHNPILIKARTLNPRRLKFVVGPHSLIPEGIKRYLSGASKEDVDIEYDITGLGRFSVKLFSSYKEASKAYDDLIAAMKKSASA